MPLSTSTASPESSASAGSPVAATQARALSRALPSKVRSVSAGSGYAGDVGQPEHLDVRRGLGDDPAQLGQLLGVVGGQHDLVRRGHRASAACCSSVSVAQPAAPRSSSSSSTERSNGAPSAVPCTSMNAPAPLITMFMSVSAAESSV